MKKLLFIIMVLGGLVFRGSSQVDVEVTLDQNQFLPGEALPAAVKITNRSGQQLHLGADPRWLTFNVESVDGFTVVKNAEVPVQGEFDLASSQEATKHVDLAPYFTLSKAGRYRVVATLRIKEWSAEEASTPKLFDVINGDTLWAQDFGVPVAPGDAGHPPEARKYSLVKANYQLTQLRLYVQVSDPVDSQVYKVSAIGPLVSFSEPEATVDRLSRLHVLYQSGASIFSYTVVDPDGTIADRQLYDYVKTRPRLGVNDQGEVIVIGGVRRLHSDEMPMVKMPADVQIPANH